MRFLPRFITRTILAAFGLLWASIVFATPVSTSPARTFVGYIDFAGTANTLRTADDATDPCAVGTSSSATLSGIPGGANVEAAYLYWAASGQTFDYTVNFNGTTVVADAQYSEVVSSTRSYFGGVEDVTSLVTGNGNYSFSGLTVDTSSPYCGVNGVLAGWALIVIYSEPSEPFRTINFFEGLQNFWGSSVSLSPNNFVIPATAVDGRLGVLSFEGDAGNSGLRSGVSENLFFDGQSTTQIALIDGLNPVNNQYNSTINTSGSTNVYGVDLDVYDVSSSLAAGDSSASTTYQSGQDRVFLMLEVFSVTNTPATDLALTKSASGDFVRGTASDFEFRVSNLGPLTHNDVITITDTLPAGLSFAGFSSVDPVWSCSGVTTVTCVHTGAEILVGADLPAVTVTVNVATDATGTLSNSATMTSNVFDAVAGNNSATANGVVPDPDLSGSSKTVSDVNSGFVEPGDILEFTINLIDANNSQTQITVTDTLSALLTNLTITELAGGTDFSTSSVLDVRDILVPAGTNAALKFTAVVVSGASIGDVIANTATITDQLFATNLDVSSVDLVVGDNSGATSGTKQLYLDNLPASTPGSGTLFTMSRVPLTAPSTPSTRVRLRRQDDTLIWDMNPATASTLSIAATAIPVNLLMRRNNQSADRNIRVTLYYSGAANGTIGCVDQVISGAALSNNSTSQIVFNVPRTDANCNLASATPLDLPAGTTIHMHVDNEVGGSASGRAVFIYPYDASLGTSHLQLPATTVINVDSLGFFDDGYPAGNPLTEVDTGDTVYVRGVVSDPFGASDISDATLTVTNSAGVDVVSADLDPTNLVDSDAASKTYEYLYVVPAAGPQGTWVASLQADEGTEGTISHTRNSNLQVLSKPVITLAKISQTNSDPLGGANPKSIPGAVIQFSIEVHNRGPGSADADSIVVVDNLPPQARLLFDTGTLNPLVFVDGSPASGLSYSFGSLGDATDDIEFSNDGGGSTTTPLIDASTGLDVTVPRINHLRINPKGTLLESANGPSFTLQLLMQID